MVRKVLLSKILLLAALLWATSGWAQTIVIGTGGSNSNGTGNDPIDDYFAYMHYQTVYTAAELSAAGLVAYNELTGLGFSVSESSGTLANYTIKIGHTSATNAAAHIAASSTTVKPAFSYTPTVVSAGSFDMVSFATNFVWNGTDNIFIDICTGSNPYVSPYGGVRVHSLTNGSRYVRSDGSAQCAVNTSSTNSNRPQIQFSYITGTPPSCLPPLALSGTATTGTTANINWTAPSPAPSNGYEYAVTTSATPPVSGTAFAGTSTSVSGLTPVTTYYLHVRSYCGGSDYSSWVTSTSFTTPCAGTALPWTENFDGVTIPAFPNCWKKENGDWTTTNNSSSTYDADARSGTQFLRNSYSATNEFVWTPGFTMTGGTAYEFKFWWAGDTYSGWTGDVFVNSIQSSTGATQLGSSFVTSSTVTTKTYKQETYVFTPGATGDYYFAIRVNATSTPWYLSFDDFGVASAPSCLSPTALLGTPTTATTANIGWTAPSPAPSNGYEYAVTTSATPPVSGTAFAGTSTSVSGLAPVTTYYLHVRSDCGSGSYSPWVTSASFTTPCVATALPWTENFDSLTIPAFPNCWKMENGDWVTTNNSNSTYDADARSGTQFLRNSFSATNEFVWTPGFTMTSDTAYEFKFWWAGDTYSGWTGDVFVNSAQSSAGATQLGSSFVASGTVTTKTYKQETYSFTPGTTGDYYFAIRVNATSNPWYLSFDDFGVDVAPSCIQPSASAATSITTSSADYNFTCTSCSGNYIVEYGLSGFTPGTGATAGTGGTVITTSTLTGTISGLSALTGYDYYVRQVCAGSTYSTNAGPISFSTSMDCSAAVAITCGVNFAFNVTAGSGSWNTTPSGLCVATPGKEVLYSFTPALTGVYSLANTVAGTGDFVDVYIKTDTGGCSDAASWSCVGWYYSSLQNRALGTLSAGTKYYIMADVESAVASTQTFNIACVLPPPANDNCAGAVAFSTIPTDGTCASVTVNTAGATGSADATCSGTEDDDVWYTFTVPAGYTSVNYANTSISGNGDRMIQVFSGSCPGTSIGCYDPESGTITGLTGGSTYLLRTYTYGSGVTSNFSICLSVPPPPPANDNCAGAKLLTNCSLPDTTKNLGGATSSLAAGSCAGTADDDVWYKFVATASSMYVTCFSSYDAVLELRSGACNGTEVTCVDDYTTNTFEDIVATGLTVGNTYYVRVYSYGNSKPSATDFVWVTAAEAGCWQGATSTNWATAGNWSDLVVPNSCSKNVTIPAGTPYAPEISSASYSVGNINISNGVTLTINATRALNVCGNWNGGVSSLAAAIGAGRVEFNGTGAQTVSGKTTFSTLQVNKSSGTTALAAGAVVNSTVALELKAGNIDVSAGTFTLKSADASNAAMLDNFSSGFTGSIIGNISAERGYNNATDPSLHKQHFFSSPINNVAIAQFAPTYGVNGGWVTPKPDCDEMNLANGSNYGSVFEYDESHVTACHLEAWKVRSSGTADNARGYSVVKSSAGVLTLSGVPNLGATYTVPNLTRTGWTSMMTPQGNQYESGWSLLGNPYSASLDLDYSVNGDFENAIQVLHTSGLFAGTYQPVTMSGSDVLAPFQGFMARKAIQGGSATFTINAANRSRTTTTFQKNGEHQMSLSVIGNGFADITYFNFDANSTTGFDVDADGGKLSSYHGQPTLYSIIGATWASINTNPDVPSTPNIPLGFNPGSNGAFQFAGTGFDEIPNTTVYLEDKKAGVMQNLTAQPEYIFSAVKGEANERFVLHFNYEAPSSVSTVENNSMKVFSFNNNVVVDFSNAATQEAHTIVIYDIMGKVISHENFNGKVYSKSLEINEPMYVVVRTNDGNSIVSKKLFVTK